MLQNLIKIGDTEMRDATKKLKEGIWLVISKAECL